MNIIIDSAVLHFGKVDADGIGEKINAVEVRLELRREEKGIEFSAVGSIWNKYHTDCISGGQNHDTLAALFPHDTRMQRLIAIWRRWHLNDMRHGCEHQREWNTQKELSVQIYTQVGTLCADVRVLVEYKKATKKQKELLRLSDEVWGKLTLGSSEPYPEKSIQKLVKENFLAPWKIEKSASGWTYPYRHPEGMLTKPCSVCGYEYGSEWRHETIPPSVIMEIKELMRTV
jgi:hypothetical protein